LAYRDEGSGAPLVLLHGWSLSSEVFFEIIPRLSERFRVLAPDLPGHGDSDPPGKKFRFAEVAADLADWLDGQGIDRFFLAGWSMGGEVAMEFCQREPFRVSRLILMSATPRFANGEDWKGGLPPGQVRSMGRNLSRRFRETLAQFFLQQFEGEHLPEDRFARIKRLGDEIPPPDPDTLQSSLEALTAEDQRSLLKDLQMPCLVIHGDLDRIVPLEAGKFLAEHLKKGRLKIMERTGHAPFLSRPQEMIDLWLDFLL